MEWKIYKQYIWVVDMYLIAIYSREILETQNYSYHIPVTLLEPGIAFWFRAYTSLTF